MCSARLTGHAEIQTQGLNVGDRSDPSHRSDDWLMMDTARGVAR